MNKLLLVGNLGADPDSRTTEGGMVVTKLRVATNYRLKGGESEVEWHQVVTFGATAEACAKYLAKGSKVAVEGRLKTRSWEKDGERKFVTEVIADHIEFLDSRESRPEAKPESKPVSDDIPF